MDWHRHSPRPFGWPEVTIVTGLLQTILWGIGDWPHCEGELVTYLIFDSFEIWKYILPQQWVEKILMKWMYHLINDCNSIFLTKYMYFAFNKAQIGQPCDFSNQPFCKSFSRYIKTSFYHQQLQIKDAFSRIFIICGPGAGKEDTFSHALLNPIQSVIDYRECHPFRSHFLKLLFRLASHWVCYHFFRELIVPNNKLPFLQKKKSRYASSTYRPKCMHSLRCSYKFDSLYLVAGRIVFQYSSKNWL